MGLVLNMQGLMCPSEARKNVVSWMVFERAVLHPLMQLPIGGVAIRSGELRVDFIDRRDGGLDRLYTASIEAAIRTGAIATALGEEIPVVPVEYLVAMKVVAADRKDQRDAIKLIRLVPELDLAAARALVAEHGGPAGANLFDTLAREAGHPDARPSYRNGGSD